MPHTRNIIVGKGWARTAVNATVFRKNSVVSDEQFQYTAYYDTQQRVILARRQLDSDAWAIQETQYIGNTADAHNIISIMLDGAGYLHMSWDHHKAYMVFRDIERGDKVSVAICDDLQTREWHIEDLTDTSVTV